MKARTLRLDAAKSLERLQRRPKWPLEEGRRRTVDWHLAWRRGDDMQAFCLQQIQEYVAAAVATGAT